MFNYLLFLLMHFDVFCLSSVYWSSNVNYMTQPPKGFDKYGQMYRLFISLGCIGTTFLARYLFTGLWARVVRGVYPYEPCARRKAVVHADKLAEAMASAEEEELETKKKN